MRRWKWVLFGWVFIGWVFILEAPDLWAVRTDPIEKDLTQKKKDLKEIKKELSRTKEKEKKIQGKESSILESLHYMETELYKKGKELEKMEAQLAQTKERLDQTKNQILMLNKGMGRTKEELFSRLHALYKMGRIPQGTLLLTSPSHLDLLKMDKYLRVIIDYDNRLVETHRYQVALKESYQRELIQDQSQWQRSISEVEKKKEEIKKVRRKKLALLKSIQNQKVVYQKLIGELEGRAKDLEALVGKLEREKSLLAYGRSKPESNKGKLIPPVHGNVISLFKEKGQNGIEIKAPMETEVRAVLPGKVLYADWFKGFGNMVIIDHGDHTFTVYAYCSQLLKKEGNNVSQGDTIALVGSAGSLKGPCLYFEIRHRGKPQDPMDWILHIEKTVSIPDHNKKGKKKL
jgi:septal ring factor EnvC (AmiA/AmiB activator)